MNFIAYYDFNRFYYISEVLKSTFKLNNNNKTLINKTACFFGDKFNFFIDTSDGVNENLGIKEYCGRIMKIIEECEGKPFLHFKTNFSPKYSSNNQIISEKHNGKTIGCFVWCFREGYYNYVLPNLKTLRTQNSNVLKAYDIGFMGNLSNYTYPKPNAENPYVSWDDYRVYGIGSPLNTGQFNFNPRKDIYEKLILYFNVFRGEGYSFEDYISESFKWKICLNAPGIGEFTARAFIHSALGQPILFRKNTYDNPVSWKEYWPEVDFSSYNWKETVENIISNYKDWSEKSIYYYHTYLNPQSIVKYIKEEIMKFESTI